MAAAAARGRVMEECAPFEPSQGYAIALTRYIDCQANLLGESGYASLAASNSPIIVAMGGLLTILIAVQGYRLLLGDQMHVRDVVLLIAKIGLVLTFATQWDAFRAVVYNLTIEAPREVAAIIPGAGGGVRVDLPARLQSSYQTIFELTKPAGVVPEVTVAGNELVDRPAGRSAAVLLAGNSVLSAAGISLLVASLAVSVFLRLAAGLLLALGPIFFAAFLFDTTRGLFEGWVRALLGTAIASLSTGVLLGIEVAIIEPQLANLVEALVAGTYPVLAPGEVLSTVLIFALATMATLILSYRIGSGFRFLDRVMAASASIFAHNDQARHGSPFVRQPNANEAIVEERSRAMIIADAIAGNDRRPETARRVDMLLTNGRGVTASSDDLASGWKRTLPPLGQSDWRRTSLQRTKSVIERNARK